MIRAILILVIAVILVFAVLSTTAPSYLREMVAFFNELDITGSTVAEETEDPDSSAESGAAKATTRTASRQGTRTTGNARASEKQGTPDDPAAVDRLPLFSPAIVPPTESVFRVGSDQTSLYTTNSAQGNVVGVLKKGEIVEPQFRIEGAGQRWTFVNIDDGRLSGFVRTDNLEQPESSGAESQP